MARGAYDMSMTHCYLTDCHCTANSENASRHQNVLPPQKAEFHPKKLPSLHREDATLSEDKENHPPKDDKKIYSEPDLGKKA
jgi:hypothetical protein